jgi:hypothetical protein
MSTTDRDKKYFWGVNCGWFVRLTTYPPHVSQFSRQFEIPNISQPHRPPQPITGIALLYYLQLARGGIPDIIN